MPHCASNESLFLLQLPFNVQIPIKIEIQHKNYQVVDSHKNHSEKYKIKCGNNKKKNGILCLFSGCLLCKNGVLHHSLAFVHTSIYVQTEVCIFSGCIFGAVEEKKNERKISFSVRKAKKEQSLKCNQH